MRLICPNCDAQYEIPEDVMPVEGRDVQCSDCNHTWFQEHPEAPAGDPEEDEVAATLPVWDAESDKVRAGVSAIQGTRAQHDEAGTDLPKRRSLDPSVAEVLRAEAELEARARRKETGRIESQPELGLDGGGGSITDLTEETIFPDVPPPAAPPSRRDVLPDIEQINSTLRPNTERTPDADPGQTAQVEIKEKRDTKRGAVFALLAIAGLTGVYIYAPQISLHLPETEDPLASYVQLVDKARGWLDTQASPLIAWMEGVSSGD